MFVDMGGGGNVDEKITYYVDMGSGPQKFDSFCFKSVICFIFSSKMFHIFKIFAHVSNIRPLNIKKMCKMMGYIMPHE